jgi:hypothetical protein
VDRGDLDPCSLPARWRFWLWSVTIGALPTIDLRRTEETPAAPQVLLPE